MKDAARAEGAVSDPSAYWAQELENIDYLIDASPLVIRKLRHHAFQITGIRPYDYRLKGDSRREFFEARWQALRDLGDDSLFVPESPALGGFGYEVDGRLVNVDTLKFFEVLVGMDRGGVLETIRKAERPLVCEIGAGWGGFAYQFKTVLPRATYVVVDFPELFLFSATYLGTVFPDARLEFVDREGSEGLRNWREADFLFLPHTLAHLLPSLPLDLTLNMVSFQEMTDAQVRRYAGLVADARCPAVYSLNRERSPYNSELVSVSEALSERYRLVEVQVLGTDYTTAMKKPPKTSRMAERSEWSYRHLVGRLKDTAAVATSSAHIEARGAGGPRVVLGMTLFNRSRHLREALDSLLAQTYRDFALVLLDDASSDGTELIAREYEAKDARVLYTRHASRAGLINSWREAAEIAGRLYPGAAFFAWVSDHDRWHPQWLERLLAELDLDPRVVLAYSITRRMNDAGVESTKGPRLFETVGRDDRVARWAYFCREAVGSGDMVYGLARFDALRAAGIFRPVLRPDRLLMAELTLAGQIRQVPEVLWFRRESGAPSITRQAHSLLPTEAMPPWFGWPPSLQHARFLYREYLATDPPRFGLSRGTWLRMLVRYQCTYGWRHFRKSETFHALNRMIDEAIWVRKVVKHHFHHVVYEGLMGLRRLRGRLRRYWRHAVYTVLVTIHRLLGRNQSIS